MNTNKKEKNDYLMYISAAIITIFLLWTIVTIIFKKTDEYYVTYKGCCTIHVEELDNETYRVTTHAYPESNPRIKLYNSKQKINLIFNDMAEICDEEHPSPYNLK